jgi:peptide deformylase
MTIREILKMGDPRLLRTAQSVAAFDTDELHLLVRDMFETMHAVNGAGLAAPQIGEDLQLVIFGTGAVNPRYPDAPVVPQTVLLNPVVTPIGDEEEEGWEGCLSVPGLRGVVPRFSTIRYTGVDPYGDPIDRTVSGFHARVVQHEVDHLLGKLYPMRVRDFTRFGFTDVLFPGASSSSVSISSCALFCCSSGPSIRKVSSTRSPSVLTLASCRLSLCRASTRAIE